MEVSKFPFAASPLPQYCVVSSFGTVKFCILYRLSLFCLLTVFYVWYLDLLYFELLEAMLVDVTFLNMSFAKIILHRTPAEVF